MHSAAAFAAALVLAAGMLGCGSDDEKAAGGASAAGGGNSGGAGNSGGGGGNSGGGGQAEADSTLVAPPCPASLSNCARASGEILYVERVDPDGDGDAHFVLLSNESITGPGISVIDVEREMRPSPLPGPGDEIAGAGPVQQGHLGQDQIHVVALRVGD